MNDTWLLSWLSEPGVAGYRQSGKEALAIRLAYVEFRGDARRIFLDTKR
ncbi:MAG: hypothetical protein ACR2JX_08985 [Mycobacteriales bacterium]